MTSTASDAAQDAPVAAGDRADFDKAARDLGWRELMDQIAGGAHSARAAEQLRALEPHAEPDQARRAMREVAEGIQLALAGAALPIRSLPEVDAVFQALARSAVASSEELNHCRQVIEQAQRLQVHAAMHAALCPELRQVLRLAPVLPAVAKRLEQAIDAEGRLLDAASPELAAARRAVDRLRERIRDDQNTLLAKYRSALAGAYFAERDGRLVLPVRTDAGNAVEGIVLGSSGSGSTLYVEPRELTTSNNDLHRATARVRAEETRVLRELSAACQAVEPELSAALAACLHADRVAALARWALTHDAHPLHLSDSPVLHLKQMRHPLLLGRATPVVANDLELRGGQGLILSGPNAGGKTVALECFGLAAWMARAGIPIPCSSSSEIGWFDAVYTDIGDDQSLSLSLSTFSAHVTYVAHYLRRASKRTLVLLDEIAGGTDPEEGAALAAALLEAFVERGAAVATTTHYERLKRLGASDAARFRNASVGFDPSTFQPTFRVTLGIPGMSSAFAAAKRFGIPPQLVERAQTLVPLTHVAQEQLLDQIERERQELGRERAETQALLKRQLDEAEAQSRKLAQEQAAERSELRRRADEATRELLAARSLLEQAKLQLRSDTLTQKALDDIERLVSAAAAPVTLGGSVARALAPTPRPQSAQLVLEPGTRVFIPHLNKEAEVLARPDKQAVRVSVSGLKMTVPVAQLQSADAPRIAASAVGKTQSKSKPGAPGKTKPRPLATESSYVPVRTANNLCDLRGVRVEHGLDQVDQFLDQMLRLQERAVFILHGHGTGAMRNAVREHLNSVPHVERWHPAEPNDGGDAVTVVWFRD